MPLWQCGWQGCDRPAAQRAGDCLLCGRHLCRTHRSEPWHECPTPEGDWDTYAAQYAAAETRAIDDLRCRIDAAALCSRASTIRGGTPCTVDLSTKGLSARMGNQNCHAEITFQDGAKWLARFHLPKASSPPEEVRDWILRSEAATMSYLQRHTTLPTPTVFGWASGSDHDNRIGAGYILMEKLEGKPLAWQKATAEQREKIMQQLVTISLELEKHPFSEMGSLIHSGADFSVEGLAHCSTFMVGQGPLGPFSSSLQGQRAMIEAYLAMIANGELDAPCPIDTYLTHRFRLDIVDSLWKNDPESGESFYLKHPDDKGDHILVNDSFDIVGIIDWEWAQTVSKEAAFCSPCMMWPVGKFYSGSNELSVKERRLAAIFEEKGRQDLALCVLESRKIQRLLFALGAESAFLERDTLTTLFLGLQRAFGFETEEWEQWKGKAINTWKLDRFLPALLREEDIEASTASIVDAG